MSRKRKHEDPVDVMPVAESWSRTEQYTVKGRHQWTIDNFLHRAQFTEVGDSLCSPIFRIPVDEFRSNKPQELQFQLEVFPDRPPKVVFRFHFLNPFYSRLCFGLQGQPGTAEEVCKLG